MAAVYAKNRAYNPTYRDLSKRFRDLREGYKSEYVHGAEKSNSRESGKSLLLNMDNTSNLQGTGKVPFTSGLPPLWVETLESIDHDSETIMHQS